MAPHWLRKSSLIEVSGLASEGFPGSHCVAKVQRLKANNSRCVLIFPEFVDRKGNPEVAEFCCKSIRLRPYPSQRPPLSQYKVGEAADALFRDIWWQGTVSHTEVGKVTVYLAESDESTLVATTAQHIRPGLVWTANGWQPRKPSPLPESLQLTASHTLITPGTSKAAAASADRQILSENAATALPQLEASTAPTLALPPVAATAPTQQLGNTSADAQPSAFCHQPNQQLTSRTSSQQPADAHVRVTLSFPRRSAAAMQDKPTALPVSHLQAVADQPAHRAEQASPLTDFSQQQQQQQQQSTTAAAAPAQQLPMAPEISCSFEIRAESISPSVSDAARMPRRSKKRWARSPSPISTSPQLPDSTQSIQQQQQQQQQAAAAVKREADAQPSEIQQQPLPAEAAEQKVQPALLSHATTRVSVPVANAPAKAGLKTAAHSTKLKRPAVTKAEDMAEAAAEAAAKAAEEASTKDSALEVRRSNRQGKRRLMMINGMPVLRVNNYDLNDSFKSISVHDYELGARKKQRVAADAPMGTRMVKWKPPAKPDAGATWIPKPKAVNPTEAARLKHNEQVRRDAAAAKLRRNAYLAGHSTVLAPFVPAAVVRRLREDAPKRAEQLPEAVQQQPAGILGQMREYQLEGLKFLVSSFDQGIHPILADEMGLGKTLQTCALLSYMKRERGLTGPSLVICPLSVLPSWMTELARWAPDLRAVRLHTGNTDQKKTFRREVLADPSKLDVVVTTYEMAKAQDLQVALSRTVQWRFVILDEGHRIKNEDSQTAKALRNISHQTLVLLTGTPLQNNLHELWALLSFMYPDVFTTSAPFDEAFNLTHHKVDQQQLQAARKLLQIFCLRRLKADVEQSLPPRLETRIDCPLTELQTFWYRRLLLKDSALLVSLEADATKAGVKLSTGDSSWKKLQSLLVQLRKVCQHPYLLPGAEANFDGFSTGEDLVAASGKLGVLERLLTKLFAKGHRVVLFSQWNRVLDILEDFLQMRGRRYYRLDGSTNRIRRAIDMRCFNQPGCETDLYLLNTRAGGLGVNLQTADTCIIYDSDWNPQWDLQAMARVHRIGQTKIVHAYRLCTSGTVEERIQLRAEKKLYLDQMVNCGHVAGQQADAEALGVREMLSLLRFGAERIFSSAAGQPPSDAQLDAIISRTPPTDTAAPASAESLAVKAELEDGLRARNQTAADFDAQQVPLSSFMLNGQDYTSARALQVIQEQLHAKRQRQQRLVNINGHDVLRINNYSLEQGEPSVYEREGKKYKAAAGAGKKSRQADWEHSDVCQVCWDGGELVLCDGCPCSYHPACLGLSMQAMAGSGLWHCPHHSCEKCARGTTAAGGLLFRCQACASAFCEDCLPKESRLTRECPRFEALGFSDCKQACYVVCSTACQDLMVENPHDFCREQ